MQSSEFLHDSVGYGLAGGLIPLVVILGPTAVGKTEIAIQLAMQLDGEIVSADSRLFYRGMDIGTAKPSLEDRMRVPHHLIDVARPDEIWSLAVFQKEARKAILGIYLRHHLPFLVGGTGQYLRAVTESWNIPAVEPNPNLRKVLTNWANVIGGARLHARLRTLDPQAAAAIDPTNVRRTIRALEVILSSGKRFSEQRGRAPQQYNLLLIGLTCPRRELYQRIDERIASMLTAGLVDEVRNLLEQGYSPGLPTLTAIGYGEIVAYIHGDISLDEAIRRMKHRTRVFVRRQANWFKEDDPEIHWFTAGLNTLAEMNRLISRWQVNIGWDGKLRNPS